LPQKYIPSDIIRFHTTPEFGTSSLDGILLWFNDTGWNGGFEWLSMRCDQYEWRMWEGLKQVVTYTEGKISDLLWINWIKSRKTQCSRFLVLDLKHVAP
jgi:hypothetical protein